MLVLLVAAVDTLRPLLVGLASLLVGLSGELLDGLAVLVGRRDAEVDTLFLQVTRLQ